MRIQYHTQGALLIRLADVRKKIKAKERICKMNFPVNSHDSLWLHDGSAVEWGEGKAGTNYRGPSCSRRSPGVRPCRTYFLIYGTIIICRLNKLTLLDQAQVLLQLRVSHSDISVKIFSRSTLVGGGHKCIP